MKKSIAIALLALSSSIVSADPDCAYDPSNNYNFVSCTSDTYGGLYEYNYTGVLEDGTRIHGESIDYGIVEEHTTITRPDGTRTAYKCTDYGDQKICY